MILDLTQRLKDRVAVITGGASGIGLATARRFAAEGAVVVIADLDPTSGEAAASEVGGAYRHVNVADQASVDGLFDGVAEEFGRLDIAFNNAGISPADDDSIETTELSAWDRVQDVNLKSVYLCSRAALRHMVPAERGSVVGAAASGESSRSNVPATPWASRELTEVSAGLTVPRIVYCPTSPYLPKLPTLT